MIINMKVPNNTKESKIYRLEEMLQSIEESIATLDRIKEEQSLLAFVIGESEHRDKFTDFVQHLNEQFDGYVKQKDELMRRQTLITECIEKMKASAEIDEFASVLFDALGIFAEQISE